MGHLIETKGRKNANQYMSIFKDHMLSSTEESRIPNSEVIFQHDNDPKDTSKKAKN